MGGENNKRLAIRRLLFNNRRKIWKITLSRLLQGYAGGGKGGSRVCERSEVRGRAKIRGTFVTRGRPGGSRGLLMMGRESNFVGQRGGPVNKPQERKSRSGISHTEWTAQPNGTFIRRGLRAGLGGNSVKRHEYG